VNAALVAAPARDAKIRGGTVRSVLALTRVESRRLITHPAMVAGPGILALLGARGPGAFHFLFLVGIGYLFVGIGAFLASNLCATRNRRDRTEELYASLPLRQVDRTAAHLLSQIWPLAASLVIAGILAASTRPWAGASARMGIEPRTIVHGLPDFLQGPLAVAFFSMAGAMLARWFTTAIAVPVAVAGFIAVNVVTDLLSGPLRWLGLVATYSQTAPEPATVMAWHLAYSLGGILLLGLVALARRPLPRGVAIFGTIAVSLTVMAGTMQVLAASP